MSVKRNKVPKLEELRVDALMGCFPLRSILGNKKESVGVETEGRGGMSGGGCVVCPEELIRKEQGGFSWFKHDTGHVNLAFVDYDGFTAITGKYGVNFQNASAWRAPGPIVNSVIFMFPTRLNSKSKIDTAMTPKRAVNGFYYADIQARMAS